MSIALSFWSHSVHLCILNFTSLLTLSVCVSSSSFLVSFCPSVYLVLYFSALSTYLPFLLFSLPIYICLSFSLSYEIYMCHSFFLLLSLFLCYFLLVYLSVLSLLFFSLYSFLTRSICVTRCLFLLLLYLFLSFSISICIFSAFLLSFSFAFSICFFWRILALIIKVRKHGIFTGF